MKSSLLRPTSAKRAGADAFGRSLARFTAMRDAPPTLCLYDSRSIPGNDGDACTVFPDAGPFRQDMLGTGATLSTVNGRRMIHLGATGSFQNPYFGNGLEMGSAGFAQPLTIFAVARIASAGSRAALGSLTGWLSPASANRLSLQIDTSGSLALWGASAGAVGGEPINDDLVHILIGMFDTGSSSPYIDGAAYPTVVSQAHGTSVLKGFAIGDQVGGGAAVGLCDIGVAGVLGGRLNVDQVDGLTQALALDWGLS